MKPVREVKARSRAVAPLKKKQYEKWIELAQDEVQLRVIVILVA
jgi:hypothetical protein